MVAAIAFVPTVSENIVVLTIPVEAINAVNVLVASLSGRIKHNLRGKTKDTRRLLSENKIIESIYKKDDFEEDVLRPVDISEIDKDRS